MSPLRQSDFLLAGRNRIHLLPPRQKKPKQNTSARTFTFKIKSDFGCLLLLVGLSVVLIRAVYCLVLLTADELLLSTNLASCVCGERPAWPPLHTVTVVDAVIFSRWQRSCWPPPPASHQQPTYGDQLKCLHCAFVTTKPFPHISTHY